MVQLNLKYTIAGGSKIRAIQFFKETIPDIQKLEGCISVQLLQDLLDDTVIDFVLFWDNAESVKGHLKSQAFNLILSYPMLQNIYFDSNCEIIAAKHDTDSASADGIGDKPDNSITERLMCSIEKTNHDSKDKYASSNISQDQIDSYLEIITTYMDEEQPFLDRNLTLVKFSNDLDIHPHHVSRVINERLHCNFSNFVNHYRVNYSKKILLKDLLQKYTISGIGNEAGFNSRSAFYNSFKKFTGMSPGDYVTLTDNYLAAS